MVGLDSGAMLFAVRQLRRKGEEKGMGEQRKREGGIQKERGKEAELTEPSSSSIFLEVTLAISAFLYWPKKVNRCLDHFSFAVIKHHDQSHPKKEGFIWVYNSGRIGVHDCGTEAWW